MTKNQLIFSVMNVIRGQAPTQDSGKFVHPQDIALEIEKAYDTIVFQYMNDPNMKESVELEYFSKNYDLPVKKCAEGLCADLPATPMPLPKGMGFNLITPKNSLVFFNVLSKEEFVSIRNLEAYCCSPNPFAYSDIADKKLYLQGNHTEYDLIEEISVSMIIKFDDYNGDDQINTPGGNYPLTQMILEQMGIRPTDNTNDDGR